MSNNNHVILYSDINSIYKNKNIFKDLGTKCLIITSENSAIKSGALKDIEDVLNEYEIKYKIFNEIKQNPTVVSCIKAGKAAYDFNADFLIGIGGGSPLDATKTASIVAANPTINEDNIYAQNWINKPLSFVLVGTTAGTGSEVTNVSVLTNKYGNKKSIHNNDIYAKYAFGDPRYTQSMSKTTESSTAIDALAHLLESYFSNKATDKSREYSIEGITKIYPYIVKINNNEDITINDRKQIYDISILGGRAIDITGTTFAHAVGYYFTETFNIPHGFACALMLSPLIDYEIKNNYSYAEYLFSRTNININMLKQEIKKSISHISITYDQIDIDKIKERYSNNNSVNNTYKQISIDQIIQIIKEEFN